MKKLLLFVCTIGACLAYAQSDSVFNSRVSVSECYERDYYDMDCGPFEMRGYFDEAVFDVYSQDSSWGLVKVSCDSLSNVPFKAGVYSFSVHDLTDISKKAIKVKPDSSCVYDPYRELLRGYNFTFSVGDSEEVVLDLVSISRYENRTRVDYYSPYHTDSTNTTGGVFGYSYSNESAGEPVRWFAMNLAGAPMLLSKNYKWGIGGEFGGEWKYGYVRNQPAGYKYSTYTYVNFYEGFFMRYAMKQTGTFRWPFVDVGAKYHIPIAYRRTDRVSNKKLSTQYLHRWDDLRLYTRVGIDEFAFTAEYNPLNRSLRGQHPLPRWALGVTYVIGGHPGW